MCLLTKISVKEIYLKQQHVFNMSSQMSKQT